MSEVLATTLYQILLESFESTNLSIRRSSLFSTVLLVSTSAASKARSLSRNAEKFSTNKRCPSVAEVTSEFGTCSESLENLEFFELR